MMPSEQPNNGPSTIEVEVCDTCAHCVGYRCEHEDKPKENVSQNILAVFRSHKLRPRWCPLWKG